MKNKKLVLTMMALMVPALTFAAVSRDTNVDLQLNADAGVAPPTGSQTAPAVLANSPQKFIDPYLPAALQQGSLVLGQTDGKARVYKVQGTALISKKGSPIEKKLKKGTILTAGDTIQTEKGSTVSITFDESYQSAIRIPENSRAVLEGIEPTQIRLENGSIFSAVDGLPQGSTWKVATPSMVAAVRGTLYLVNYQTTDGRFYAATVNIPNDGKNSAIDIQPISGAGYAHVPEGKQISLKEGETPDTSLVQDIDSALIDEILKFFIELTKLRPVGNSAPATSGQYDGPGSLDAAGPGVVGGDENRLDIQETGSVKENPSTSNIQTSETATEQPNDDEEGEGNGEGEGDGEGSENPPHDNIDPQPDLGQDDEHGHSDDSNPPDNTDPQPDLGQDDEHGHSDDSPPNNPPKDHTDPQPDHGKDNEHGHGK